MWLFVSWTPAPDIFAVVPGDCSRCSKAPLLKECSDAGNILCLLEHMFWGYCIA